MLAPVTLAATPESGSYCSSTQHRLLEKGKEIHLRKTRLYPPYLQLHGYIHVKEPWCL